MSQRGNNLLVVLVLLALAALACNLSGDTGPADSSAAALPTVNIQAPVSSMSFVEGANVVIQVVGADTGAGISRIDLQIDDLPAGSSTSPVAAGQSVFIATFEWPAMGVGAHAISAVALRADGTASAPTLISINVVAAPATEAPPTDIPPTEVPPTEAPAEDDTAEQPAEEPTEEEPTGPQAVTNAGINVRSGPGTDYPLMGSWLAGTELELTGRNADNTWFRAPYYLGEGWMFAGLLDVSGDVNTLPVINVPPPPTAIPPTAVPPTIAPAPVATAAPAGPSVNYWSTIEDGKTYDEGTCFRFFWETSGVKAVYFEGEAQTGSNSGGIERCPSGTGTKSFTLRVILPDDSVDERQIFVTLD